MHAGADCSRGGGGAGVRCDQLLQGRVCGEDAQRRPWAGYVQEGTAGLLALVCLSS